MPCLRCQLTMLCIWNFSDRAALSNHLLFFRSSLLMLWPGPCSELQQWLVVYLLLPLTFSLPCTFVWTGSKQTTWDLFEEQQSDVWPTVVPERLCWRLGMWIYILPRHTKRHKTLTCMQTIVISHRLSFSCQMWVTDLLDKDHGGGVAPLCTWKKWNVDKGALCALCQRVDFSVIYWRKKAYSGQ